MEDVLISNSNIHALLSLQNRCPHCQSLTSFSYLVLYFRFYGLKHSISGTKSDQVGWLQVTKQN